jgi:large subunit ribosomal protein L4
VKAAEQSLVMVDNLKLAEPKTRLMANSLAALVGDSSVLVLIPNKEEHESVLRATRNLPDAKIMLANYLNIRDLLVFDKLVMPVAALDVIQSYLG